MRLTYSSCNINVYRFFSPVDCKTLFFFLQKNPNCINGWIYIFVIKSLSNGSEIKLFRGFGFVFSPVIWCFVVLHDYTRSICSEKKKIEAPLGAISWKSCVTEMWNNLTSLVVAVLLYYWITCFGERLIIGLWMMMNNEDILYVGVDWKVILFCATI